MPVAVKATHVPIPRFAPDYARMSDDTLAAAKQRAAGPSQQKLGAEIDRRQVC